VKKENEAALFNTAWLGVLDCNKFIE